MNNLRAILKNIYVYLIVLYSRIRRIMGKDIILI